MSAAPEDASKPAETPPPELVMGCNTPEGLLILADWLDEHGGDGAEFREHMRDVAEMPTEDDGYRDGVSLGDGLGDGDELGYGSHDGNGFGDGDSNGRGQGYGNGSGDNYDSGNGDGGPDAPRD